MADLNRETLLACVRGWAERRDDISSAWRLQGTGFVTPAQTPDFSTINEFARTMDDRTRQLLAILGPDFTPLDLESLHELTANFSKILNM